MYIVDQNKGSACITSYFVVISRMEASTCFINSHYECSLHKKSIEPAMLSGRWIFDFGAFSDDLFLHM